MMPIKKKGKKFSFQNNMIQNNITQWMMLRVNNKWVELKEITKDTLI